MNREFRILFGRKFRLYHFCLLIVFNHLLFELLPNPILIEIVVSYFQESKRSSESYFGRNETNVKVIISAEVPIMDNLSSHQSKRLIKPGDFVVAHIDESNSQTLKGTPLFFSSISHFYNSMKK